MKDILLILMVTVAFSFVSCKENGKGAYVAGKEKQVSRKQQLEKSLRKVNRYLMIQEKEEIDNFVNRHKWNVKETGSGLRYEIYEKGKGAKVKKGNIVSLDYKMYLITGDMIYTSDSLGPKVFKVGRGGVESGLEEMVLLMHQGDKVHVILPSHLAYGLKGDMKKIPKRSTIIYDLQLTEIK